MAKTVFQIWELKNSELLLGGERKLVAEIAGTKHALKQWVAYGGCIPTHMGELRKNGDGYLYYTTIGRTYLATRSRV